MPQMQQDEFKFPDEQEQESQAALDNDEGIEIEIEDDTPVEDRGKTPMPKALVEELERDELDDYDEKVKIKLKQMRKVWHDERREKESAVREQQEAVSLAKRLLEENKRIKDILSTGEKEYVTTATSAAEMELEMAKRAYKDAYDAGDSDKLLDAQQAMQMANLKLIQARNFKLPPLQDENTYVEHTPVQAPQVPKPDQRAQAWQERNPWFGQNRGMTAYALGVHEELREDGIEVGSDEYYRTLDRTMRKRFPESFDSDNEQPSRESPRNKPTTVVAPATRSTSSNKIRLKASQIQLARKLGITPEQYAQAALKAEAQNG